MDTMDGELTMQDLLVVSESLEPYVLTYQPDHATDGAIEITALVVLKREEGVLLALPKGTLSEEVLERGRLGRAEDVFGPSALVTVPGVILDGGSMSATGTTFEVLLVDCLAEVVHSLREFRAFEEIIYGFEDGSSFSLPDPVEISSKALAWVEAVAPSLQRVGYYSAQEEPGLTTPRPGTPTLPEEENVTPRRRKPGNPRTTSDAKPKKVTTADLAASMEGLLQAIPTLTSQVDQLHRRQVEFEASLSTMPLTGRPTLSKPLGGAPTSTSGLLGTMAKTIPAPPRTQGRQAPGLLASPLVKKPLELAELEKEKMASRTEDSSLAQAVLAQSQALTTLVTQIAQASGDPMSDLAGSSATPGSRGALGRAKLQAELAAQRGTFFNSVVAQMSRRMNPTSAQELGPKELLEKGINGVRYLERFGGYGRQRDIGCLQYQVMQIFDCLMDENILAARDLVALLAITLEQMNMDGGRMDLASVVCLHEDPPSSIFQMRHLSSTSRSRAFAPLADQKLITVALAYLKELDVIQSKRFELVGTGKGKTALGDDPAPKVKAKGAPKRKQRWKEKEEGEEET